VQIAIVAYCNSSDFSPKNKLDSDILKNYLSDIAKSGPQKERMMTQYWQLDEKPVESKEFRKELERYLR